MDTFFFVWLPGGAIALFVLVVIVFLLFWGIPKVQNLKLKNADLRMSLEEKEALKRAERIMERLSSQAEDDAVLEVQIGSKNLREINEFLNKSKQLER